MRKPFLILLVFSLFVQFTKSQDNVAVTNSQNIPQEFGVGIRVQKTEGLYWENGVSADYTADFLLHKHVHLKLSYVTSRLGTALATNAIRQDNYILGADWRFMPDKPFQIFTGLNTGFFHADMENSVFNVLPHNSLLLSVEAGLSYKFKKPFGVNLSAGYNVISGDGVSSPGTLFPVYYQLSVFYYFGIKK